MTTTTASLSPRMASMLTWLAAQNYNVNIANRQTRDALIRRGLIELVPAFYGEPVRVTEAGRAAVAELQAAQA